MEKGKKYSANSYLDIRKIWLEKREEIFKIMKEEERPFHHLFDVSPKEMAKHFILGEKFSDVVKKTLIYLIDQCPERGLTFDIPIGSGLNLEIINVLKNEFITNEFKHTQPLEHLWFCTGWMYEIKWTVDVMGTRIQILPVNITDEYMDNSTFQKIDNVKL